MYKKFLILLVLITSSVSIFPQYGPPFGTLSFYVSPRSIGAGGTGTANIKNDPFGYWDNPAYLGYASNNTFISAGFYPQDIGYFNKFNTYTISGGYNLKEVITWFPVSIGAAFSGVTYDADYMVNDKSNYYSLSLGFHSLINISVGLTGKHLSTEFFYQGNLYKRNATAFDYGILLNIPLNSFLDKPLSFPLNNSTISTSVNYSIGYSIQNVGERVDFPVDENGDALPRTARLAHNLNLGFALQSDLINIELLNISYSIDVVDLLLDYKLSSGSMHIEYKNLFGGIKPGRNLFLGKSDHDVDVRKGIEMELGEILCLSWGGFDYGYGSRETSGYALNLNGLLKITNIFIKSNFLSNAADKFNFQYYSSTDYDKIEFEGIAVTISGF